MTWTQEQLEHSIDRWRDFVKRPDHDSGVDAERLEAELRGHLRRLIETGLLPSEALLVAFSRIAKLDATSRAFLADASEGFWADREVEAAEQDPKANETTLETLVAFGLALAAAIAIKVPELFGQHMSDPAETFYARNISLLVFPFLTGFLVWKRGIDARRLAGFAVTFMVCAILINAYPFALEGFTERLSAIHLPIALWLVVGLAYAGGRWNESQSRMDFVRFSGEAFIYYVLIALGGGVFMALTVFLFKAIGLNIEWLAERWLLPCGAAGAVIVAAWLAESRQRVMARIVPMLAQLFAPLFAIVMVAFLVTMAWTRSWIDIERDVLIGFDVLLVLIVCLVLFAVSSRPAGRKAGASDILQLILIASALLVDLVALAAVGGRISEFGLSPNKVTALGLNLILLVSLAWSVWLYVGFLRKRRPFGDIERWQTAYLPVYAGWAAIVFAVFPLLFGFS